MIVESGDFRGVIARCDDCGRTSGWLDDPEAHEWAPMSRTWRPTDGFGEWFILWSGDASKMSDSPEQAHCWCPDCKPEGSAKPT